MSVIESALLFSKETQHTARLWSVTPTLPGADVLRFTDHDTELVYSDGETYYPGGAFDISAYRAADGLRASDRDAVGPVTINRVTFEGIRTKAYRGAAVVESLICWLAPWMGPILERHFKIRRIVADSEVYRVSFRGLTEQLEEEVGDEVSSDCPYELGSFPCPVALASFTTVAAVVNGISTSFRIFDADDGTISGALADGYFTNGKVTWTTGQNTGLVHIVKGYTSTDRVIELAEVTPFPIEIGDEFSISAGCNKRPGTQLPGDEDGDCGPKFNALVDYGGEFKTPGQDEILKVTAVK